MNLSKRSAPKIQAVPTADPEVGAKPSPSKRSARQPSFGEASREVLCVAKKLPTCQKGGCRAPQAHRRGFGIGKIALAI